jgi:hypothetical protein
LRKPGSVELMEQRVEPSKDSGGAAPPQTNRNDKKSIRASPEARFKEN